MNLYLVSRTDSIGYDEFSRFVVAAKSEDDARRCYPRPGCYPGTGSSGRVFSSEANMWMYRYGDNGVACDPDCEWPVDVRTLKIACIGKASEGVEGVILSQFNAG